MALDLKEPAVAADVHFVVTLKVWQLMLGGLALLVAIAFLMMRPGSSTPSAAAPPAGAAGSTVAVAQLRAALPAVKAYGAKHHGYAGLKLPAPVTVVSASKQTFCIETAGVFKDGPTALTLPGACPRA